MAAPHTQEKPSGKEGFQAKPSIESVASVVRPAFCDAGRPVPLYANCFKLKLGKPGGITLKAYSIEISREASRDDSITASAWSASRLLKSECIWLMLQEDKFNSYRDGIVTDHQANLYSVDPLPEDLLQTSIRHRTALESEASPRSKEYIIQLEEVKTLDLSSFARSIESPEAASDQTDTDDILMALNIFLGHCAQSQPLSMTHLKDRNYDHTHPSTHKSLGGGLEAIPGFFSSVRLTGEGLLLNINTSTGVFYKPLRLDHLMNEWNAASTNTSIHAKAASLQTFLKHLRIRTLHSSKSDGSDGNPRPLIKRIWGLAQKDDGQGDRSRMAREAANPPRAEDFNPPNVPRAGANPSEVEFYHKGRLGYITVLDYFEKGMSNPPELAQNR
ncbi:MAG: hypothetical protein Q9208_005580 [Pyrenodesmia sp. 3 TL-2023]